MSAITDENVKDLARQLVESRKNIILVFAFNGTGKTRFSVEYKNITKEMNEGNHSGVYYNAYWSYVNILDTKSQTFYAALLANNSH